MVKITSPIQTCMYPHLYYSYHIYEKRNNIHNISKLLPQLLNTSLFLIDFSIKNFETEGVPIKMATELSFTLCVFYDEWHGGLRQQFSIMSSTDRGYVAWRRKEVCGVFRKLLAHWPRERCAVCFGTCFQLFHFNSFSRDMPWSRVLFSMLYIAVELHALENSTNTTQ